MGGEGNHWRVGICVGLIWNENPSGMSGTSDTGRFILSKTHRDLTSLGNGVDNANIDLRDLLALSVKSIDIQDSATIGTDGSSNYINLHGYQQIIQNNTSLGKSVLDMTQNDADQPLLTISGTTLASEAIGNTLVTDGINVGPNSARMGWIKANIIDFGGHIVNGIYHIPFYALSY